MCAKWITSEYGARGCLWITNWTRHAHAILSPYDGPPHRMIMALCKTDDTWPRLLRLPWERAFGWLAKDWLARGENTCRQTRRGIECQLDSLRTTLFGCHGCRISESKSGNRHLHQLDKITEQDNYGLGWLEYLGWEEDGHWLLEMQKVYISRLELWLFQVEQAHIHCE